MKGDGRRSYQSNSKRKCPRMEELRFLNWNRPWSPSRTYLREFSEYCRSRRDPIGSQEVKNVSQTKDQILEGINFHICSFQENYLRLEFTSEQAINWNWRLNEDSNVEDLREFISHALEYGLIQNKEVKTEEAMRTIKYGQWLILRTIKIRKEGTCISL